METLEQAVLPAAAPVVHSLSEVVEVTNFEDLAAHRPAWERLCRSALEPNVFYEPWMLLPTCELFGQGRQIRFVFLYAGGEARGFFPLLQQNHYRGIPVRTLSLWKHEYSCLGLPLIHRDHASDVLQAFMNWFDADGSGSSLLEFKDIPGEGPFRRLLIEELNQRAAPWLVSRSITRALLERGSDAETYLQSAISGERRRALRRHLKRLSETGFVEFHEADTEEDVAAWTESFLSVESSGWKGQAGTAFKKNRQTQEFFRRFVAEGFRRRQLMPLELRVDGRMIAGLCNLLSPPGSFSFKIAYDEAFARYSPGVQIMIENTRRFFERTDLSWMDSCANPNHPMINHVWTGRRTIERILVSRRAIGSAVLYMEPLRGQLERRIRRIAGKD